MQEFTINEMFKNSVQKYASKAALSSKIDGSYQDISYDELDNRVKYFCLGLIELGLRKGDRVALLSENRPEWAISDLAILAAGGVNVPMFWTLTPAQVEYILRDSAAKIICVSNKGQLQKVEAFKANVSSLERVITFDAIDSESDDSVVTFADVCELGKKADDGNRIYRESSDSIAPGDFATLIYTSGTTGDPKGVVLTHSNLMSNAQTCTEILGVTHEDVFLAFLPLSHVFERMAGHYLPLACGSTVAVFC
ncbi:MAG: AMP-binding protein [Candidatus Poribacteria bacterium]